MEFKQKDYVIVTCLFVLSLSMLVYYISNNYNVHYYDETLYLHVSNTILKQGLFNSPDELRTYFYPLLIALTTIFTNGDAKIVKIIFSVFQYSIFVTSLIYALINILRNLNISNKICFYVPFVFTVLNPYLVQGTTLFLTDMVASSFALISLTTLVTKNMNFKTGIVVGLFLYASVMTRPSSAIFMILFFVIFLYRVYISKKIPYKFIAAGLLTLVIFYPQLYSNVTYFHKWTPLISTDLYHVQSTYAARVFKYGTVVIPNEVPQLFYRPTFSIDAGVTFFQLLWINPLKFLLMAVSHVFGVLDWGIIDTFIKDYNSPGRYIASFFLYVTWALIGYGVYVSIKTKLNNRVIVPIIITVLGYTLFIATTCVESRFGYPIFMVLVPFTGIGLSYLSSKIAESRRHVVRFSCVFAVVIALFYYGSYLMDLSTGRINWF